MEADRELTANFVRLYELTVVAQPPERGTAGESGIYAADEPVTLTATSHDGSRFLRWEGAEVADKHARETTLTLTEDTTITALFGPAFELTIDEETPLGEEE